MSDVGGKENVIGEMPKLRTFGPLTRQKCSHVGSESTPSAAKGSIAKCGPGLRNTQTQ